MATTWKTITIEGAKSAVKLYNNGTYTYGCLKNPDLDQQALDMFTDGFGSTAGKIQRQEELPLLPPPLWRCCSEGDL